MNCIREEYYQLLKVFVIDKILYGIKLTNNEDNIIFVYLTS